MRRIGRLGHQQWDTTSEEGSRNADENSGGDEHVRVRGTRLQTGAGAEEDVSSENGRLAAVLVRGPGNDWVKGHGSDVLGTTDEA